MVTQINEIVNKKINNKAKIKCMVTKSGITGIGKYCSCKTLTKTSIHANAL